MSIRNAGELVTQARQEGYDEAIADVAAYMRFVRHATGVANKIELGHAKGCAEKARKRLDEILGDAKL